MTPGESPWKRAPSCLEKQVFHFTPSISALLGDQEYFCNVLGLPHWSSHYPCWECNGENFAGCTPTLSIKELDFEKSTWEEYSHADLLAEPWSDHLVFQLPYVSAKNVRGDPMHILFCKGIYSHVIGGILHYACWWEGPGKVCKERPWKRLALIFEEVQLEYKAQGLNNRLTNLKLSMLTDPQKPWVSKACLDIKAGEAKHLLPALLPVLEKIFGDTRKEEEQKMISAAKSLEKLVALWDAASTFLTSSEVEKAMNLGKEFLLAYKWLHAWSLEKGRNSFSIVNKFHTFIHMWMGCKFMNPKKQWCFKGEDYVGHISKMAHSISFGVSSTRISNKICPKYRVLQHFIICRDMEQLPWKDEADD